MRLKQWIDSYRLEKGFRPLTKQDLVFCNPKIEDSYTVTLYSRYFREMRDELGLNPDYTLYLTRFYFVNEGIRKGRDTFDLETMTGHDFEVERRHYVRSQIRHKQNELTIINLIPKKEGQSRDLLGF